MPHILYTLVTIVFYIIYYEGIQEEIRNERISLFFPTNFFFPAIHFFPILLKILLVISVWLSTNKFYFSI